MNKKQRIAKEGKDKQDVFDRLEGWFDNTLADLPIDMQELVKRVLPHSGLWDYMDTEQRQRATRLWDYQHDTKKQERYCRISTKEIGNETYQQSR